MAQGTAEEIIASQGLATWAISDGDLAAIAERLRGEPGIDQIAAFGSRLHVTGRDAAALEATLRRALASAPYRAEPAQTGLEDVFIHLMDQSVDNYGPRR
jgi:ABC-2 type transport system ATP-binding protein